MGRLSPAVTMSIGFVVLFVGIMLTITRAGDLADGLKGLIVGIGFGLALVGLLKRRRSQSPKS